MDEKSRVYLMAVLGGLVILMSIYFVGYKYGYTCARTDLEESTARKAATRAMLNQIINTPDNSAWLKWGEALSRRDELVDEYNKLVDAWDGKDAANIDAIGKYLEDIQQVLETAQGPPGAEWYRDALLNEAVNRQKVYELIKQGIQTGSNSIYVQGLKLEEKTNSEFSDATERYEQWLAEEGY